MSFLNWRESILSLSKGKFLRNLPSRRKIAKLENSLVNKTFSSLEERVEVIEKRMPLINLLLTAFGKVGLVALTLITAAVLGLIFIP